MMTGQYYLRNGLVLLTTRSSTHSGCNSRNNCDFSMVIVHRFDVREQEEAIFFLIEIDFLDIWIPGRKKQPDAAFVPRAWPNPTALNAALVKIQLILGVPFPTLVLEVGVSQRCADILRIRDRTLSYLTGVNVFVAIVYNRNKTRGSDSWYMEVAVRDYFAPEPPPGTGNTYPPCIVLFETAKINSRYPSLNTRIRVNNIWQVPVHHLYHPQSIPILEPLLPPHFEIDVEYIRSEIEATRLA
jgi:hypothetical protein